MDVKTNYLQAYEAARAITSTPLKVSQSVKLAPGGLARNRYFVQFNEAARPEVAQQLASLGQALGMPATALERAQALAQNQDVTFLGAAAQQGQVQYRLYFGFVGLRTVPDAPPGVAVSWQPQGTTYTEKVYDYTKYIEPQQAQARLQQALGTGAQKPAANQAVYDLCLELIGHTDYGHHFLQVSEPDTDRLWCDFSLVEGQPVTVGATRHLLLQLGHVLGIDTSPAWGQWIDTLADDEAIEHLGAGTNGQGQPFVTLYMGHPETPQYTPEQTGGMQTSNIEEIITFNLNHMRDENFEQEATFFTPSDTEAQGVGQEATPKTEPNPVPAPTAEAAEVAPSDCSCQGNSQTNSPGSGQVNAPAAPQVAQPSVTSAGKRAMVYAIGTLGFTFSSPENNDSFTQRNEGNISPKQLLELLDKHPYEAPNVVWVLQSVGIPIYAIRPAGAFATTGYEWLRQYMSGQEDGKIERVALAGTVMGTSKIMYGPNLPVVVPDLRGFAAWNVKDLIDDALGEAPDGSDEAKATEFGSRQEQLRRFLERVYYELRNEGLSPQDRAINYAATNVFLTTKILNDAFNEGLELDQIYATKSPISPVNLDRFDVRLTFFNPKKKSEQARKAYEFTVDVTTTIPFTIGDVRSWYQY